MSGSGSSGGGRRRLSGGSFKSPPPPPHEESSSEGADVSGESSPPPQRSSMDLSSDSAASASPASSLSESVESAESASPSYRQGDLVAKARAVGGMAPQPTSAPPPPPHVEARGPSGRSSSSSTRPSLTSRASYGRGGGNSQAKLGEGRHAPPQVLAWTHAQEWNLARMTDILEPAVVRVFLGIGRDAEELTPGGANMTRTLQSFLRDVPVWPAAVIQHQTAEVRAASPDVVRVVQGFFVANAMLLHQGTTGGATVPTGAQVQVPSLDKLYHTLVCTVAERLFNDPSTLGPPVDVGHLRAVVRESIHAAARELSVLPRLTGGHNGGGGAPLTSATSVPPQTSPSPAGAGAAPAPLKSCLKKPSVDGAAVGGAAGGVVSSERLRRMEEELERERHRRRQLERQVGSSRGLRVSFSGASENSETSGEDDTSDGGGTTSESEEEGSDDSGSSD